MLQGKTLVHEVRKHTAQILCILTLFEVQIAFETQTPRRRQQLQAAEHPLVTCQLETDLQFEWTYVLDLQVGHWLGLLHTFNPAYTYAGATGFALLFRVQGLGFRVSTYSQAPLRLVEQLQNGDWFRRYYFMRSCIRCMRRVCSCASCGRHLRRLPMSSNLHHSQPFVFPSPCVCDSQDRTWAGVSAPGIMSTTRRPRGRPTLAAARPEAVRTIGSLPTSLICCPVSYVAFTSSARCEAYSTSTIGDKSIAVCHA